MKIFLALSYRKDTQTIQWILESDDKEPLLRAVAASNKNPTHPDEIIYVFEAEKPGVERVVEG